MPTPIDRAAIDRVIRRNLSQFRRPGVLTVRPGYELRRGKMTDRPAIVVTVDRKRVRVPARERLPDNLEGYPVDVRTATAMQRLRLTHPKQHAVLSRYGRDETREAPLPYERRVRDGKLLERVKPPATAATRHYDAKPELPYTPAPVPLRAMTGRMTILAGASPDAGFTMLAQFLAGVRERLTVALYDFTSASILKALVQALGRERRFRMVLDHPALNPTANQPDSATRAAILRSDREAAIMWALTRGDPDAARWIFPSAYHIKVAVRDGSGFWLSSGNWNVSNQPDFAAHQASAGSYDTADRDWHVIVSDAGLARVFEQYIEHDFQVAGENQMKAPPKVKGEIRRAVATHQAAQGTPAAGGNGKPEVPFTLGRPQLFKNVLVKIQPLLTPDRGRNGTMYVDNVLALIRSARRRLYLQYQYVVPSDQPGDRNFMLLIEAVADALRRRVDVRLITSQYEKLGNDLELLHAAGLSGVLRIQERVHNKGIVVDSRVVLVSSQNWSAAGTLRNRDAGLIIHHTGIARFFERNFLQDWERRATDRVAEPGRKRS